MLSIGPLSPAAWVWTRATRPLSARARRGRIKPVEPARTTAPSEPCRKVRRATPPLIDGNAVFVVMKHPLLLLVNPSVPCFWCLLRKSPSAGRPQNHVGGLLADH